MYYRTADEATGDEDNPRDVPSTSDPTDTPADETEKDSDAQFRTPRKKSGDTPLPRRSPRKAMQRRSEDERSSSSRKRGMSTGSSSEEPTSGRTVRNMEFSYLIVLLCV